jgi:hypothetical protein
LSACAWYVLPSAAVTILSCVRVDPSASWSRRAEATGTT